MKIIRFKRKSSEHVEFGCARTQYVYPLKGDVCGVFNVPDEKPTHLGDVSVLPPFVPGKVVLVGLNYRDHALELSMPEPSSPIIFIKPASSVIGQKDNIVYPPHVTRLDYEAELAIVIKHKCRNVKKEQAKEYILGYTCLNDVTARDLQKSDGQWTRAKSFDTFCPIGPVIETDLNTDDLRIATRLNGRIVQESTTKNMIFKVPEIIAFISSVMTLEPFDVISTGTPAGIGPMQRGDTVCVSIEGIGELENYVV